MDCYTLLINEIKNDSKLRNNILNKRKEKLRGKSDLITTKSKYRLIGINEIESFFSKNWLNKCSSKLKKLNSINGIRYLDSTSIIIEINHLDVRGYKSLDSYSRNKTYEVHRLIYTINKIDKKSFQFKFEKLVSTKKIKENLTYEITQYKR
ncbi:hypothetical protein [Polaribacter uvawellassae]|uniref:hypothetical protein n=1 Tax=Polaribacter uvawellassae TaxID=3133495 RepID=UPI00321C2D5B